MRKKIIITIAFVLMLMILTSNLVQANYQSIGTGSAVSTSSGTFITGIRKMESAGKGMGLTETINTTTGLSTSGSNNIDVHMLKNTEYGAILLLGASDYGKQGASITDRRMDKGEKTGTSPQASTTGNKYGIYELGTSWEWTAAGLNTFLPNVAPRYVNVYGSNRVGDALSETNGWHGSTNKVVSGYGAMPWYRCPRFS